MTEINKNKEERRKNESKLSDHKQFKKELKPPFLTIGNISTSAWFDERMPEMLWAVLVIGNIEREKALEFFRRIARFSSENADCYDVTLTGISKFSEEKRREFIRIATSWSEEVKKTLRALALFPDIPAGEDWRSFLDKSVGKEDWQKISTGVSKTFWHQSEEATDCRWIKFFCQIVGGKMKFSSAINGIDETLKGVFKYPNYGDLKHIRPFIRASEIMPDPRNEGKRSEWARSFWQYCFDKTGCFPEEAVSERIKNRQKKLSEEMEDARKHYFKETVDIRNKLIDHFFANSKTSAIDSRHEGAFGIALYGVSLFIEIIFYRASLSITGRVALRSLVESFITFKYLLKKEKTEQGVWDDYRGYGTGQLKLLYLKLIELGQEIGSIEIDELDYLANEDKSVEFVPINLGHWDSANLRKISEEVGLKDIYDTYYGYTSGYMHANWGAVRESIYQKCLNPLHRFHRVPTYDLPLMPSVTADARKIVNFILDCLSEAYPKFDFRFTKVDNKIKNNMNYQGVIIEESLENKDILKDVHIFGTKVEKVIEKHKTPWIKQWTLHSVEIPENQADSVAEKVSKALDSEHSWYADFKNEFFHYVIFRDKVFKVDRSKKEQYNDVVKFGISLGIPDYQLDFSPQIREWER